MQAVQQQQMVDSQASTPNAYAAQFQPSSVTPTPTTTQPRSRDEIPAIQANSYATVVKTQNADNLLTVRRDDGQQLTYDPKRLSGISAYRQVEREFAMGDRIQFTGIDRALGIANRDLATITRIEGTQLSVRTDGEKGREFTVDAARMRHIDHGYAVTSHSSQGLTADRVIVNMDTAAATSLLNPRFAYVSVPEPARTRKFTPTTPSSSATASAPIMARRPRWTVHLPSKTLHSLPNGERTLP